MSNNNWKRVGGFSRTGTQNYVRTNDATMGGTTFGSTDVSNNTGNTTLRIGNNAGVVFINGDIDMSGGPGVGAPINRVRNVRDPIANQDVATKFYVDKEILAITALGEIVGPKGEQGPPGIGFGGQNGSDGPTGATGCTGAIGPPGNVVGVKGPTGESGGTGATGTNGAAGATGPIGPVGEKGTQGTQGTQGIQGSNGTILWLNPDGDSTVNQLITDSYMLSTVPVVSTMRTIGPISVSATYGNSNKIIPGNRFWNTAQKVSTLAVIPSGVWALNLYANVPSNSDANQVSLYAAVFMISGTLNQPSPDSLIIETKDGGDAGYYPPRAAYLPDHVKYIGKSWTTTDNVLTDTTTNLGAIVDSTTRKLYKVEMPVDFITLKDASGNSENVYVQLQIYIKNTKAANQTANINLYYQADLATNVTTYSYLQTTFGAVGIQGIEGKTGPAGLQGAAGSTGPVGILGSTGLGGPTGTTGAKGPEGVPGPTGPTGPAGQSNSVGRQYAVQYRSNMPLGGPTADGDVSGSFAGNANFRFLPTTSTMNASDASAGTVVLNDLACNSIHSSFYVEDPSLNAPNIRPRTFVKGGEFVSGAGGGFIVLASGKDTSGSGGSTKSPATVADITHGFKLVHNMDGNPPTATLNLHNGDKAVGAIGMKFDLTTGNVSAAQDKFCLVYQTGAVGVGGMTPGQMTDISFSGLYRALHVCGNVMVGKHPGAGATEADSAMILFNKATTTPTNTPLTLYPGVYHRSIAAGEVTAVGGATNTITTDASGLGFISPNFITFQTGLVPQKNSIVINQAGDVSVTGRANLNGPVSVGKNFGAVEKHLDVMPIMDVSGILHIRSSALTYTDNPRMKLISTPIGTGADIPSLTIGSTANEIRGVNDGESSGFLRLSAHTPANSCIDLIGTIISGDASKFTNSVRISTAGVDRMVVNGSGNVGIGTTVPGVRLDVSGAASVAAARIMSTATTGTALITTGWVGINNAAPTVPLDVAGAAKISGELNMNSNKIVNVTTPTAAQDAATKSYVDAELGSSGTQDNRPTVQGTYTTATTHYLTFINSTDLPSNSINKRAVLRSDDSLTYNPSTNTLTATTFSGSLSGNASTAGSAGSAGDISKASDSTFTLNGTERMRITSDGRVGIGTTAPGVMLDVRGRINTSGLIYSTNSIGIGTESPLAPLHVGTYNANSISGRFFDVNGNNLTENGTSPLSSRASFISIVSDESIWIRGWRLWVTSDQRIKKNIVNLNADKMINVFRTLRPISFDFIDPTKTNNKKHFGFIAQEINEVLPEGISLNTDVIPNNMMKGGITKPSQTEPNFTLKPTDTDITLQYLLLTTESPLKFDTANPYSSTDTYKFKVYCGDKWTKEQDIYIRSDYNVIDYKYTYVIGMKKEAYDTVITEPTLFVYGQYVNDLHILDHDTIYTVATAALQEVDRQQQADKARIADLETTVAAQQSLINDILERLKKAGM
jgi:hypothetical protein